MDRRGFVRGSAVLAAAPFLARGKSAADRPNILLITADDLGWKDLSCYGSTNLHTPNIDALAEEGVRFTNAFVTSPSCSASRASIITGQAPHSVHVLGLTHIHTRYQMSRDVPTLPGRLQRAGYRTGIHGKWHVAAFKMTGPYGYDTRMSVMRIESSRKARGFITRNRNQPFYLELNFMQTHRPNFNKHAFSAAKGFPVDPDSIEIPEYWRIPNWPEIRKDAAGYFSQAMEMDRIIGEIMDHLEDLGLAGRTLVLFVSDNGPPYPGCKMTLYDRGIGTPLIMRWPGELPSGAVRDGLVSTVDLMPTCLEAAGAAVPDAVQGTSLLPLAKGSRAAARDEVFAELTFHVTYAPMRAIRTRRWKYIENLSPDPTGLDQCEPFEWAHKAAREPGQRCCVLREEEELYDLSADPHEENNLVADPGHAVIKQELVARLHQWRKDTRDPFPDLS